MPSMIKGVRTRFVVSPKMRFELSLANPKVNFKQVDIPAPAPQDPGPAGPDSSGGGSGGSDSGSGPDVTV